MNQLISIFFLASGGCEEWLNGNVEVGSSSVVAKIFSSSSIKRCAGSICLRDDLLDNSRGEASRPLHLSIYLVLSLSALGTILLTTVTPSTIKKSWAIFEFFRFTGLRVAPWS